MPKDPLMPDESNPPTSYRVPILRMGRPWLSANDRLHWNTRARITRLWRTVGSWSTRDVPRLEAAHIICELRLHGRIRRDPSNWAPTAKAIVDGLVDGEILRDDDHTRLLGPDMRRGPNVAAPGAEQIILHIWPRERMT